MSKNIGPRKEWTRDDDKLLLGLWDIVQSVYLIAIIMKRTRSSIQTRASRLNLPTREDKITKHRRRWKKEDEQILEKHIISLMKKNNNQLPIVELSKITGRSIDALAHKIEILYGRESIYFQNLTAPIPDVDKIKKKEPVIKRKGNGKIKTCLKCRKQFWSEGNHNWICSNCKRSDEWE